MLYCNPISSFIYKIVFSYVGQIFLCQSFFFFSSTLLYRFLNLHTGGISLHIWQPNLPRSAPSRYPCYEATPIDFPRRRHRRFTK